MVEVSGWTHLSEEVRLSMTEGLLRDLASWLIYAFSERR